MMRLARPDISFDEVADDIRAILESGHLTQGAHVKRFEALVAEYLGVRYAFATTSATTALHLALVAGGIGPGDEVLVSDFTFPASGNAIVQAGAVPVLVDCTPNRFDMDPADLERKITRKSRAVMPVDPFGQPARLPEIHQVAERHGLTVIEDAACALGAEIQGRRCGGWSGAGCLSFHPRKVLTTGEGGMITTNDDSIAERITLLRSHGGRAGAVGMEFLDNGYNYRMSEIQAALGVAQIQRFDAMLEDRRRIAQVYMNEFADIEGISIPLSAVPAHCTFQSFVLMLDDAIDRNAVIRAMKERGVETTLGTYAMHSHAAFARFGYKPGDLPHSLRAQNQSLTIPLLPGMNNDDAAIVVGAIGQSIAFALGA